ncbi:MAG: hypothetical protein ACJA13_002280 [Paraglaciecola sp.]|jgi:hypothetical protein
MSLEGLSDWGEREQPTTLQLQGRRVIYPKPLEWRSGGKGTQPNELAMSVTATRLAIGGSESSQQRCSFKGDGYKSADGK